MILISDALSYNIFPNHQIIKKLQLNLNTSLNIITFCSWNKTKVPNTVSEAF